MAVEGLSLNLGTVRRQWNLREAVEACARHGFAGAAPWRDQVEATGIGESARIFAANGIRVTGYCRGGMFAALDERGRQAAIDDNKRMIDEAAALGAECIVMIGGGLPKGSRDIAGARASFADGIAAVLPHARACGVPLALEPLHPMYAADRGCVTTLAEVIGLCDALGDGVGVAVDVYHVWWDPDLERQIARAGARIIAHHICDWLVPTRHLLTDRGMMGDGVIDLAGIRAMIEKAGYRGLQEVEIFSEDWWDRPGDEVLATAIKRYETVCQPRA
ncbi:MAG TPA: sugar phosphate isomerase/epimerase family protein [Xanthobacteraceae bacterium]|nr:sugar phosphate isomerase/epimerase family protein [Xanthobacteraceae bacterium]